jgi:hypothetical protein
MPSYEVHCQDCIRELGEDFGYVHKWLDELFPQFGPSHRDFRHHVGGVEEVRNKWGDDAARAAEIHIIADVGFVPTIEQVKMWSLFS